jgi:hypothetical protein
MEIAVSIELAHLEHQTDQCNGQWGSRHPGKQVALIGRQPSHLDPPRYPLLSLYFLHRTCICMSTPRRGIPTRPSRGAPSPARSSRASLTPVKPSLTKKPSATRLKVPTPEPEPEPSKPKLSLKEQIALKRSEQQKQKTARSVSPAISPGGLPEIDQFLITQAPAEDDILGRLSVRETIDRARVSGTRFQSQWSSRQSSVSWIFREISDFENKYRLDQSCSARLD